MLNTLRTYWRWLRLTVRALRQLTGGDSLLDQIEDVSTQFDEHGQRQREG